MKNVLQDVNLFTTFNKYIENIKGLKDSCTILKKINYDKEEIEEKEEESTLLNCI